MGVVNVSIPGKLPIHLDWAFHEFGNLTVGDDGIIRNSFVSADFQGGDGATMKGKSWSSAVHVEPIGPHNLTQVPQGWGPCKKEPLEGFSADSLFKRHGGHFPLAVD